MAKKKGGLLGWDFQESVQNGYAGKLRVTERILSPTEPIRITDHFKAEENIIPFVPLTHIELENWFIHCFKIERETSFSQVKVKKILNETSSGYNVLFNTCANELQSSFIQIVECIPNSRFVNSMLLTSKIIRFYSVNFLTQLALR